MKRKASIIVSICFVLIIFSMAVLSFYSEEIIDWKQIHDDKITEQEQNDFEALLNTKTFYYYNTLNDEQKRIYIMLYSMFEDFTESRRIEATEDELKEAFMAVHYDNSDFFWVDIKYSFIDYGASVEFSPNYRFDRETAESMKSVLNNKINEIVKGSEKYLTDYEKELYFHNCICEVTDYDEETFGKLGDTAYSALINGKAICEGYARAMQLLLDKAGIPSYLVVGDVADEDGTEAHMWNVVEIDGENYHLDVTWDDTVIENGIGYMYFNVNDELISRDHTVLATQKNNCVSMDYNYFVINNLYVKNFKSFDELIYPVASELQKDDNIVEILFADEQELSKAMKYLEKENYEFFDFISKSVENSNKDLQKNEIEYYTIDEFCYLCLIFKEG